MSVGRVRDVVLTVRLLRRRPRVSDNIVEPASRRRIVVPVLRVAAIEPVAVTPTTGNVSLLRFAQRATEVLVMAQVLDARFSRRGAVAVVVAPALHDLPVERPHEVAEALDDERLADVVQELPGDDRADLLGELPDAGCWSTPRTPRAPR